MFTQMEKYRLYGLLIKAVTGVLGISMILTENHPYISIGILAIGAGAAEWVSFIKEKEDKSKADDNDNGE